MTCKPPQSQCVHTQQNEPYHFLFVTKSFGTSLISPFFSLAILALFYLYHSQVWRGKYFIMAFAQNTTYCSQNRQTYRTNVPHKHTQYVACSQVSEFRVKVIDLDLLKTHLLGKGKSKIQCTANGTSFAQQRIIPILKAAGRPAIIDVCPCSIQTYAS